MSVAYATAPGRNVRMAGLPSACPAPELRAHTRLDPYWDGVWSLGAQGSWVSEDIARRQVAAGLGHLPAHLAADADRAWSRMFDPVVLERRLDLLGVLDSWRTVTSEQIAAFTGHGKVASGRSIDMAELFQTGLADVGIFTNALLGGRNADRASLYRPSRTNAFRDRVEPQLSYAEWLSVTGGSPFESGGQFDRHNILTAELALRAAEWCDLGMVVGEKTSSVDLLGHSGLGLPPAIGSQRAADATFIRPDGVRIAVEVTASAGASFDRKVRRWAELLDTRRMRDSGLVVVFVVAERPDKKIGGRDARSSVLKAVASAVRDYPGVSFDRTASRMFVADWREWFPSQGMVSEDFLTLTCDRPSGPAIEPWERASLVDVFDVPFEPADDAAFTAVLDQVGALRSVPFWMRRGAGRSPEVWPIAVTEAGFDRIPVPPLTRPESSAFKPFGEGTGAAGDVRAPRRLRMNR